VPSSLGSIRSSVSRHKTTVLGSRESAKCRRGAAPVDSCFGSKISASFKVSQLHLLRHNVAKHLDPEQVLVNTALACSGTVLSCR
jgi:hypothetical protein